MATLQDIEGSLQNIFLPARRRGLQAGMYLRRQWRMAQPMGWAMTLWPGD